MVIWTALQVGQSIASCCSLGTDQFRGLFSKLACWIKCLLLSMGWLQQF